MRATVTIRTQSLRLSKHMYWCLQTTARRNSIPIDSLSFEYSVVNIDERELQQPPKEGVYVKVRHYKHTLCVCIADKAGSQPANAWCPPVVSKSC